MDLEHRTNVCGPSSRFPRSCRAQMGCGCANTQVVWHSPIPHFVVEQDKVSQKMWEGSTKLQVSNIINNACTLNSLIKIKPEFKS